MRRGRTNGPGGRGVSPRRTVVLAWRRQRCLFWTSSVFLDRFLDRAPRPGQVVGYHDRVNLDARIEREEPWFGDRRNLRRVLEIEENEPRALAVGVREIDRLRLQVSQDRLDGRPELAGLGGRVPGFHGDIHFEQESHGCPPVKVV